MGTQLQTSGGGNAPPGVKLPNIGNSVKFAVIDCNPDVPVTEFNTGAPKLNSYGKPKKQTVLTVLILGHEGATVKDAPAEVGTVASLYVASYAKYDPDRDAQGGTHVSLGGALDLLDGGLQVGDVGEWKYLQNLPSQGAEPRKDRKFRFRRAKPEEAEQTARCEQLRAELKGNVLVQSGAGPFDGEDDSF
jgi:hypothetical protein